METTPAVMIERINPADVYELRDADGRVYPQAIRTTGGTQVHLSGMVALDADGAMIGRGDMAVQAATAYANVGRALAAAGATPADVVSCTVFATDLDAYRAFGAPVAAEFFGLSRPVSTVVEVSRLADPDYLLEVQAIAHLADQARAGS